MTQTFKIGDRVTVVDANRGLTQGETYTVRGYYYTHSKELLTLEGRASGYYGWRFVLADEKPEVGDTVEATDPDGTTIRGVVTHVYGRGALDVGQRYVSSAVVIEKVKKPKVWAVGDVVTGGDYASETIKDGTLVGTPDDSVIKRGDTWIDCQTGDRCPPVDLGAARTIVFIP